MSDILAALAVVIEDGEAVLVRRSHRPDAGLWGFPGGKVEPGEDIEAAAVRELAEETGLVAAPAGRLGHFVFERASGRYRLEAVLCRRLSGSVRAGDDAEEARWFPVSDIVAGRLPMSRDVARLCLRAAARLR